MSASDALSIGSRGLLPKPRALSWTIGTFAAERPGVAKLAQASNTGPSLKGGSRQNHPPDRLQRLGRLAAGFLVAGAVAALAIAVALGSTPRGALVAVLPVVLLGGLCLIAPWETLSPRWLLAPPAAGSLAAAVAIGVAGEGSTAFAWLLVPVALFCALALSRGALAVQLVLGISAVAASCLASGVGRPGLAAAIASAFGATTVAVAVALLRGRLETSSHTDPLTGVGNYRELTQRLRYELLRHERHRRSFAVLLLDLDRFKLVNDRFGHPEGDRLLRAVASRLAKVVRDQDTVARQGGDEFSVLLPETGNQGVAMVASKIDLALGELVVGGMPLRASIGWSVFPQDGASAQALLAVADERQRQAKRQRQRRQPDTRVAAARARVAA
jgi:diguanylate cyclase (GGDEF)-like protein